MNNPKKIKRYHRKNRLLKITVLAVVIAALLGGIGYAVLNKKSQDRPVGAPVSTTEKGNSELIGDKNKQQIIRNEESAQPSDGKKEVTPAITFAGERNGQIEVRSYVDGVYESNGKCTATFIKGGEKLARTVAGIKDAAYTRCGRIVISPESFPSTGNWSLVISYGSPSAGGSSESRMVSVQ